MSFGEIPQDHIGEITLIGTGGGYGESIVIHAGSQNWIVIDSCLNPKTRKSLPLEYLESLMVDLNKVQVILCTHWHDDHILGLSQLIEKCPNAIFCMASTTDRSKFLQFLSLDYQKLQRQSSASSTEEFLNSLKILKERKTQIKFAGPDRHLKSFKIKEDISSDLYTLSPSDFTIQEFQNEISTLISDFGPSNRKIIIQSPNAKSVVTLLKLGKHRAILGADLEVGNHDEEGWLSILKNSQVIDEKSTFFKISHHGSENGFHEDIWGNLLGENTCSALTPWNKNQKLPKVEMLKTYSDKTDLLFMTTPLVSRDKPKDRDKNLEKTIARFNKSVREVKFEKGIVRSRINLLSTYSIWCVELINNSIHVNEFLK